MAKKLTYDVVLRAVVGALYFCEGNLELFSLAAFSGALNLSGVGLEGFGSVSIRKQLIVYIKRALIDCRVATNFYLRVDLSAKIPDEYMPYLQNYRNRRRLAETN